MAGKTSKTNASEGGQSKAFLNYGAANKQESSRLFQLPPKLRTSIYTHLFHGTRISHGSRAVTRRRAIGTTPAPRSLALLRACCRFRAEIGDSWLGQVLFSFEDTITMMNKLANLPAAALPKIRHVRLREDTWMHSFATIGGSHYRTVHFLKFLPGLQLDTFTVLNLYGDNASYDSVNTLMAHGQGCKELRYISHASTILDYARPRENLNDEHYNERYKRKPQPGHWPSVMNRRDGAERQPSLTVYQSTLSGKGCTVINEATRDIFEQKPPAEGYGALFPAVEHT